LLRKIAALARAVAFAGTADAVHTVLTLAFEPISALFTVRFGHHAMGRFAQRIAFTLQRIFTRIETACFISAQVSAAGSRGHIAVSQSVTSIRGLLAPVGVVDTRRIAARFVSAEQRAPAFTVAHSGCAAAVLLCVFGAVVRKILSNRNRSAGLIFIASETARASIFQVCVWGNRRAHTFIADKVAGNTVTIATFVATDIVRTYTARALIAFETHLAVVLRFINDTRKLVA
jgi:hypothetical protein